RPRIGPLGRALARALHDLARELLALRVALLETVGERLRLVGVLGEQQPQGLLRVRDAARRVETRAEDVADVRGAHATELQTAPLDQRADAGQRRAIQRLEAAPDERAVPAAQRDDVGDGRERDELEQLVL